MSAAAGVSCGHCGTSRPNLPSSWRVQGDSVYCEPCAKQVECYRCKQCDTKGAVFKGRWHCQACRRGNRSQPSQNLQETFHRLIIEDDTQELPSTVTKELRAENVGPSSLASLRYDSDEESGDEDSLAPLPLGAWERVPRGGGGRGRGDDEERSKGHVVLLLDASGSMRTEDVEDAAASSAAVKGSVQRLEAAALCAARFCALHAERRPSDVYSVALFGERAEVLAEAVDPKGVEAALGRHALRGAGGTRYQPALAAAEKLLLRKPSLRGHVVLLSDGRPGDQKAALEHFQERFLNGKLAQVRLHGIGFGHTVESFVPMQQLTCLSGGSFLLSACTVRGLAAAFSTVSSTITWMSSGVCVVGGEDGADARPSAPRRVPRPLRLEPPEIGDFGRRGTLRFRASRSAFRFDGEQFHESRWPAGEVVRRARPYMCGGMRLVYGFRDAQVAAEGSWMVSKCSRYVDEALNSAEAVQAHAKSTAVARYFAALFNEALKKAAPLKTAPAVPPALFFVPCFVYEVAGAGPGNEEPRFFAGERYLPGVFLKYNSNNGYVSDNAAKHNETVQAFLHFTFAASNEELVVADLQGVAREQEMLLTDPQVLSLTGAFGSGDLRAAGMRACLAAHRCGPTCRRLGLRPAGQETMKRLGALAKRHRTRRQSSSSCGDWERASEAGSSIGGWDHLPEGDLVERYALSEGGGSSQVSASSWVHLLDS